MQQLFCTALIIANTSCLLPYVLSFLMCLVPYLLSFLTCIVPCVFLCFTYLVLYVSLCLACLVPYLLLCLTYIGPYVLLCLICLVFYVVLAFLTSSCLTCSRAWRALNLRVLVLHVPRTLRSFVSHVPYVLSCLTRLESQVLSAPCASVTSGVLCPAYSHASHASQFSCLIRDSYVFNILAVCGFYLAWITIDHYDKQLYTMKVVTMGFFIRNISLQDPLTHVNLTTLIH